MTDTIAALRAERESLLSRVRMIDAALEKYDAWEREVKELLPRETAVMVARASGHASVAGPDAPEGPPAPSDGTTPMAEFEEAIRRVLETADRPLMRGPMLNELHHRGVIVGGADERNTLSARLSRLDWVVNLRGHGYWLRGRDYAPADYGADDATSTALVGQHEATAANEALDLLE